MGKVFQISSLIPTYSTPCQSPLSPYIKKAHNLLALSLSRAHIQRMLTRILSTLNTVFSVLAYTALAFPFALIAGLTAYGLAKYTLHLF